MGVRVREDLPVKPGQARSGDLARPCLNVGITLRCGQHVSRRAVVVVGVVVARTPS